MAHQAATNYYGESIVLIGFASIPEYCQTTRAVSSSLQPDDFSLLLFDFLNKYLVGDNRAQHYGTISLNYLDAQVLIKGGEILDL